MFRPVFLGVQTNVSGGVQGPLLAIHRMTRSWTLTVTFPSDSAGQRKVCGVLKSIGTAIANREVVSSFNKQRQQL